MKKHDSLTILRRSPLLALVALLLAGMLLLTGCDDLFAPVEGGSTEESGTTNETPSDETPSGETPTTAPSEGDNSKPNDKPTTDPTDPTLPDISLDDLFGKGEFTLVVENIQITSFYTINYIELTPLFDEGGKVNAMGGYVLMRIEHFVAKSTCVLKDGKLFVEAISDYDFSDIGYQGTYEGKNGIYMPISDLFSAYMGIAESKLPFELDPEKIVAALQTIVDELTPALSELVKDCPTADEILNKIFSQFFSVTTDSEGNSTIRLDLDKVIALNDRLETLTVGGLVDALLGEDAYDKITKWGLETYTKTLGDLMDELAAADVDVEAIIRAVASIFPDDSQMHKDILGYIEVLKATEFRSIPVYMLFNSELTPEQAAEQVKQFKSVLAGLKTMPIWTLIEEMMPSDSISPIDPPEDSSEAMPMPETYDEDNSEDEPTLHDMVDQVLQMLKQMISFEIKVDADGNLLGAEISAELGAEKPATVKLVKGHKTEVDYSKVETTVNEVAKHFKTEHAVEAIKSWAKKYFDEGTTVTYDETTGIVTISYVKTGIAYSDQFVYKYESEYGDKHEFRDICVKYEARSIAKIDLNTLLDLQYSYGCTDRMNMDVFYMVTSASDVAVEIVDWRWNWDKGEQLTEEEQRVFDEYILQATEKVMMWNDENEVGSVGDMFDVSIFYDTSTAEWTPIFTDESDHDYEEVYRKEIETDDPYYQEWIAVRKCKHCGALDEWHISNTIQKPEQGNTDKDDMNQDGGKLDEDGKPTDKDDQFDENGKPTDKNDKVDADADGDGIIDENEEPNDDVVREDNLDKKNAA